MEALREVAFFPVRHHSPRSSAVLQAVLARRAPLAVLVEGPADASGLIDVLVDDQTCPPVAILGYRSDGTPASGLWPFAAYSPEYVALRWAREHGAHAAFVDLDVGTRLAARSGGDEADEGEAATLGDGDASTLRDRLARTRGCRSFEEFWEAAFEAPDHDETSFREALLGLADLLHDERRDAFSRARDACMARHVLRTIECGVPPERILVVAGAAHVAALVRGDLDDAVLPPPLPATVTLIPFSFPRLAEQAGYGAGNRAPRYYQRAHDGGCDFRRASLEVLVVLASRLRERGFSASLADTLDAWRLALTLADLRAKAQPGLDEVREAAIATMGRGEAPRVDASFWPTVVGCEVGRVASRIGRNSLQEAFWREVRTRRLPAHDAPEAFTLKLRNALEVETSVFLHRLRIAAVPYADLHDSDDAASALARVHERWQAQWTPATDLALVERIVLGDTFEQVASRVLAERLRASQTTSAAAETLLEAVVASLPEVVGEALTSCDTRASADDDLPSLARACRALSGLVSYGSSRRLSQIGDDAIPALCRKTFARAVLRVEDACAGNDDAVGEVLPALRVLHDIALAQPVVDRAAWERAARRLVGSHAVHPQASGAACGLLYLAQMLSEDEVALALEQRLSDAACPKRAAAFLTGFVDVNGLALARSRPLVAAVDAFICRLEPWRFRDLLPVLRRALSHLGPTERRRLLENVFALRGSTQRAPAVVDDTDRQALRALSADLADALGELDDLL